MTEPVDPSAEERQDRSSRRSMTERQRATRAIVLGALLGGLLAALSRRG